MTETLKNLVDKLVHATDAKDNQITELSNKVMELTDRVLKLSERDNMSFVFGLREYFKLLDDTATDCFRCPLFNACSDFEEIANSELCHFIATHIDKTNQDNE